VSVEKVHAEDGPDWVELNGLRLLNRLNGWGTTDNWRVIRVDGGSFDIGGTSGWYLSGNDWGPCDGPSDPCGGQNFLGGNSNLVIDGDTIHDFRDTSEGAHFECLFITGTTGKVTIRKSRFYNCYSYAIFLQAWHELQNFSGSLLIENNWFGRTCCYGSPPRDRESAITFASARPVGNVLIRFNSFALGQAVTSEGGETPFNTRIVGNIIGTHWCLRGATYAYNVMRGGRCDRTDVRVPSLPYVNPSGDRDGDYRLTGRRRAADDRVAPVTADFRLGRDRDGDRRKAPRDAGADERP